MLGLTSFLASIQAVSQILLIILSGVYFARKGVLSPDVKSAISQLIVYLFLPCLLVTSVAETITLSNVSEFWPLPVSALIYVLIAWILSNIISRLRFWIDNRMRIVIKSGGSQHMPTNESIHQASDPSIMKYHDLTDTGPITISIESSNPQETLSDEDPTDTYICAMTAACTFRNIISIPLPLVVSILYQHNDKFQTSYYQTFDSVIAHGTSLVLVYAAFSDIIAWAFGSFYIGYYTKAVDSNSTRCKLIRLLLSPPVLAVVIGLLIGLISPIRSLFYPRDALLYNIITRVIEILGTATNPCLLILFGASVYSSLTDTSQNELSKFPGITNIIIVCVLTLILIPGLLVSIVFCGSIINILPQDPVLILVLLIEACTPATMDLPMICSSVGNKMIHDISVVLMFYQYLFAIFTLTAWLTIFIVVLLT